MRSLDRFKSVPTVATKDANGNDYTHAIEPELKGAAIPRVTRMTHDSLTLRRWGWNIGLGITGLVLHLSRNVLAEPAWWLWTGGVLAAFAAALAALTQKQNRELRFLREGVAVHGLVRSGEIDDSKDGGTLYWIHYTYWVGGKMCHGSLSVSSGDYGAWMTDNPYFTVLYDAAKPSDHLMYSQITCAELVAR